MITNYQIQANIQNNERCNVTNEVADFIQENKDEVISEVEKMFRKTEHYFGKTHWRKAASIMKRKMKKYQVI